MKRFIISGKAFIFLMLMGLMVLAAPLAYAGGHGTTEIVSVSSEGAQGNGFSGNSHISADGSHVSFISLADNLVPGDVNGVYDIFIHDLASGATELVSVSTEGVQGNDDSTYSSNSADGSYVAFASRADNLVPGDVNGTEDVFIRDRVAGTTELVSVSSGGIQGNGYSAFPSISADGSFVAFNSFSSNLVIGDENGTGDVFVHDLVTGATELVSVSSGGTQGNGESRYPAISADGRYVAFLSYADNLVPGDLNARADVFVHDRVTGLTELVSVSSGGIQGNNLSDGIPAISADGRYVAFRSRADNLVPGDVNGTEDVFVRDRVAGTTGIASVDSNGNQANNSSLAPSISADGRFVAFTSYADNLVPRDRNVNVDIFVRDRAEGSTEIVSVSNHGLQGDGSSTWPSISADGLSVAFQSSSTNLVPQDNNSLSDVFVHQR